ncbi:DUF1931 family protein [Streptomyces flaveolus]|uniref:DUF1931 family protein n=1 Tax=Streptomyces flaveolus TaxID=67297 RepID=UPI00368A2C48
MSKFERFFRAAAGLDVDGNDLKRYGDFVDAQLYDLPVVVEPPEPVDALGGRAEADTGTARRAPSPRQDAHPLDRRARSQRRPRRDVQDHASGWKNPQTGHWEDATEVFDRLL